MDLLQAYVAGLTVESGADGRGINSINFLSSTGGSVAGIAGATDTYKVTYTDKTTSTFKVYNGKDGGVQINDETASEETTYSATKIEEKLDSKIGVDLIYMKGLGFTPGSDVSLVDFMNKLLTTVNKTEGFCQVHYSSSFGANVVDDYGKSVPIVGGWLFFDTDSILNAQYKNGCVTVTYYPENTTGEFYRFITLRESGIYTGRIYTYLPLEGGDTPIISDTTTSETSTWSSAKVANEITSRYDGRFPTNESIKSSSNKAIKITRYLQPDSVVHNPAFVKLADPMGNLYTLQMGWTKMNMTSSIVDSESISVTEFAKDGNQVCYLYPSSLSLYLLETVGDVTYSVVDKTEIPDTAEIITVQ